MELDYKILLYLDKRRILAGMRISCESFLEQLNSKTLLKFPPLRYMLQLDVMDLIDLFPDVGEYLIEEPLKWQRCCDDILCACLKSLDNGMISYIKPNQVSVIIRIKCFPTALTNTKQRKYDKIVSLCGLVTDIGKPVSYIYHTVWSCNDKCEGNETIMNFIPKVPPKCNICRSTLFENSGLRSCGEQVIVTFKLKSDLLPKKFTIYDDLIPKLQLGKRYNIIAVILKKATVWSIEEYTTLPAPITSSIPSDVKELFVACKSIPWKFIYCLASSIGVNVCPLNCFMNIKISLLLSLVSVKANFISGSAILHFFATGYDTGYVSKLMRSAALLADCHTLFGTSNSSVSTMLIGSSGGICVMSLPLQAYSQQSIHSLLSVIETGEISQGVYKTNLRCAVWAQGMELKKNYNIGSVFGIVSRGDYGEYADEIVEFVLDQAINPYRRSMQETQALRDISAYIDIISAINVTLAKKTEELLQCYFLTARKERPNAMTASSLNALVTVCGISARLCRRNVANIDDAIFAIWLHINGMPEPRFAPEEYLQTPAEMKNLKKVIENFINWLEQFTGYCIKI